MARRAPPVVVEILASVGFDWPDVSGVIDKVHEELGEVLAARSPDEQRDETGDLLFAVVNLARHLGVDPEAALRAAATRFEERFRIVEADGTDGVELEELDRRWDAAKRRENETGADDDT